MVLHVGRVRWSREGDVHSRHGDRSRKPPVTPTAMGKSTRGVEIASAREINTRQLTSWMKQAALKPFFGAKKKKKR